MTDPDDIPDDVMEAAAALRNAVIWQSNAANVVIARALLAEREKERERIAREIECDCCDVCGESPGYPKCANEVAAAIRRGDGCP